MGPHPLKVEILKRLVRIKLNFRSLIGKMLLVKVLDYFCFLHYNKEIFYDKA